MDADVVDLEALERGLTIQQASALLGVPAPTLRSWERRYGLPSTRRSRGGHRRYSENELRQLQLMRDEVALGRRAADAALRVRMLLREDETAGRWVAALLEGARAMEPEEVDTALDGARSVLGLASTVDEVLIPAVRQVGNWWASGECDVGQEHLATETVRRWLVRAAPTDPPRDSPVVVLACGPRDQHTVGLEALGALLAARGMRSYLTGALTPPDALVSSVRRTGAAGAVVASQLSSHRRAAVEALQHLTVTGLPLFYAGNAFLFAGARNGVPGTYLGESIAGAAEVLVGALT